MTGKPLLAISPHAAELDREMLFIAKSLLDKRELSPASFGFRSLWKEFLDTFTKYQIKMIDDNGLVASCKYGCSFCCSHWVEDVYSFESEIIATELTNAIDKAELVLIRDSLYSDEAELLRVSAIVDSTLSTTAFDSDESIDHEDLLLSSFYQLSLPCPLLDKAGMCRVYNLRPLTCRAYCNFGHAEICRPENIN